MALPAKVYLTKFVGAETEKSEKLMMISWPLAICPSRHFCPADSAACLVKARLRHGSRYYHLAH